MQPDLQTIKNAADGLQYLSESDYPFEVVELLSSSQPVEQQLLNLLHQPPTTAIEKQTLSYCFRNMTATTGDAPALQQQTAARFTNLQTVLEEKLKNVTVYRIGHIQVEIFIIGQLQDGTYAGLRTKAIET